MRKRKQQLINSIISIIMIIAMMVSNTLPILAAEVKETEVRDGRSTVEEAHIKALSGESETETETLTETEAQAETETQVETQTQAETESWQRRSHKVKRW